MNKVFIATSIDGYIADKDGGIDFLHSVPNPTNDDLGYSDFMSDVDAIVMGRNTFDVVHGFDIDWPYTVPVFVLSERMNSVPEELQEKVKLVKGPLKEVLANIHKKGAKQLYIDGGKTIQSFLREDLIDEMTITIIPTILGDGVPLFEDLNELKFKCTDSKHLIGKVAQHTYKRTRSEDA
ncbi:MAG: dihydrofolate reductase family protein [Crocinitomicaceae bacterium]